MKKASPSNPQNLMQIKPADVVKQTIGSGCVTFYAIVRRTAKSIFVQEMDSVCRETSPGYWDEMPDLAAPSLGPVTQLRIGKGGKIGPDRRWIWFSLWDGKPAKCFSD